MFVTYMHTMATPEGDPAGYLVAWDYIEYLCPYPLLRDTESLWIVPGSLEG